MSTRRRVMAKKPSGNCATAVNRSLLRGWAASFLLLASLLMTLPARAELIVLAAPTTFDSYYAPVASDIFTFHVAFAKSIKAPDRVLILTDAQGYDRYAAAIGEDKVLNFPVADIWARDFAPSNAARPIFFRYTAEGQGGGAEGQEYADIVQINLAELVERAGLKIGATHLLNDGGNFVDDYAGNVVISTKFLADNDLTEDEARAQLQRVTGITNVAFIDADEQGGLEHADGVVSFVDTNTLVINSYPEDPAYRHQLYKDLERGLPGVTIHEIVTPYDGSEIYDEQFGSACGLYTNALVTPARIYLPQFGIPEDAIALAQVRAVTSREVIPVSSGKVCRMGGGVRCMSWQLRGARADALLAFAASERARN